MKKRLILFLILLIAGSLVIACGGEEAETPVPVEATEEVSVATEPPPTDTPEPPTATPEPAPTEEPTVEATEEPTVEPTEEPTVELTEEPTVEATEEPTVEATEEPTVEPTEEAPVEPTEEATAEAEAQPQAPALSGRIIYPLFDEERETYDIYWAKPDGSDRELLVEEASQPDLKPNGNTLVYRSWQPDDRGIYEYDLQEEENIWRINEHFEAGRPLYFPDGKSFLFQSREAGAEAAIYETVETEYEVLRREGNPIQGEAPALTPDGEAFVYKTCIGTDCGLFYSNIDGSSVQQLTSELSDTNPAISPDGQTVAFMSEADGNWEVYTIGIDGSNRMRVTDNPERDGLPFWSPDGNWLGYASEQDEVWSLWAVSPDGDNQQELFALEGPIDGQVSIDVANSFGWLAETLDWEAVQ